MTATTIVICIEELRRPEVQDLVMKIFIHLVEDPVIDLLELIL